MSARPCQPTHLDHRLSLMNIERAAEVIDPAFLDTPTLKPAALSAELGCDLTLKDETSNPVGCFKGRGAAHFVAHLLARTSRPELVCASAGNFGLALAYACAARGLTLTVFAALTASEVKIEGIRRYGARVISIGRDFDAAKLAARAYAHERGVHFVEDGAEPEISEGAGVIAVELLAKAVYDVMLVPLGNGALLAGMARWVKALSPLTKMIGVCATGAPVMHACLRGVDPGEHYPSSVNTIADGIGVRIPVRACVEDLRPLIDDVVLVDDEQLLTAMRLIHRHTGLACEASAAAGVAALCADRERYAGKRVATVLTGRNLTQQQLALWFS